VVVDDVVKVNDGAARVKCADSDEYADDAVGVLSEPLIS